MSLTSEQSASLGRFEADISAFEKQLEQHLDEFVQNVAFEIAQEIIFGGKYSPGTPIDTGFARASWWISINDPGKPHQAADNPGRSSPAGGPDLIAATSAKVGDNIYLLTNTVYMGPLEYGWSDQAPEGFVRLTLNAAQRIVEDVAHKMGAKF